MVPRRVLIIAGSDSGGGAGIQADLKTVSVLGAFGMTAVTALTAQNTTGVHSIVAVEASFVARQIDVCVSDIGCDAVKTGMLANRAIIEAVTAQLRATASCPLVVDPVLAASSGTPLLEEDAVDVLKSELLPLATVITPNLLEAAMLAGHAVGNIDEMRSAAEVIHAMGPRHVVVKGGHLPGKPLDVLFDGSRFLEFPGRRFSQKHTHGTGCVFASALATGLAQGKPVADAVALAKAFVTLSLHHGLPLGKGRGPVDPLAWSHRAAQA